MSTVFSLTRLNLIRIKRRLFLLIAAAAAFAMLSFPLAAGAESLFAGENIEGISIAVAGENSDTLADFAANMEDISRYCSFVSTEFNDALDMLDRGEVTAVLELPDDFVGSILTGENSPARVHINGNRPAESLLTVYVGQCAADMLSAAQGGIYTVLDALRAAGEFNENSVLDINLEYIKFTMNRSDMYVPETVTVTGELPIGRHYALSIVLWLLLASGVVFCPMFRGGEWARRLKALGCSGLHWAAGVLLPLILCQLALSFAVWVFVGGEFGSGALCLGIFASGTAGLICAVCPGEASCGMAGFVFSTAVTALGGGIVPPLLMPAALRESPIFAAANALRACALGRGNIWVLLAGLVMLTLAAALLSRGFEKGERV